MKKDKISLVLAGFFLSLIFTSPAFALNADSVLSHDIREADGTSGQNTNSGSGVKTGHIQDGAVTGAKIADGAVTDSKIGGTISQSKVTGLEATLAGKSDVTHNHDVLYQQKYGKVAIVAQTGGDYADPVSAMNDLATWCGTPSANNPCLVKILPGIYDIGSTSLTMINYVDVEGSGENVTKITGNGVVNFLYSSKAELRMITVESRGASAINIVGFSEPSLLNVTAITLGGTRDAKGMYLENVTGLKMNNVHISVSGGTYSNVGISYFLAGGQLIIENVSVLASGGQIAEAVVGFRGGDMAGSLIIRNATLEAKDASNYSIILDSGTHDEVSLVNVSASAQGGPNTIGIFGTYYTTQNIINSSLKSSGYLIQNPKNINIVNSQLDGGPIVPIGPNTVKCIGVYDGNYNPYTCPQ